MLFMFCGFHLYLFFCFCDFDFIANYTVGCGQPICYGVFTGFSLHDTYVRELNEVAERDAELNHVKIQLWRRIAAAVTQWK